jgi:hypothetical protein
MRTMAEPTGPETVLTRLRELIAGLLMPTRGGCVCDPVAWERDARRRLEEFDQRRDPAETTRGRAG